MTDTLILVLISIPSALVTVDSHLSTSSDPPPSYTTYPEDDRDRVVSPYSDSSSIPLASRCHRHLVPKLHPTKTRTVDTRRQAHPHRLSQPLGHQNEILIHDERKCTCSSARGVGW